MNRTDRLYAIVEELRAVAPRYRTAQQLAERFEVSVRTIERDVLALQEAGVPVHATPGRRGGYGIDPNHTLPPVNFSAAEATAVAIALGRPGATPLGQAARTALQKLVAAMARPDAEAARSLARRVQVLGRPSEPASAVPAAIERALVDRRVVHVAYEDKAGAVTERDLEPAGFVGVEDRWYLVAWCRLRGGERVFRVDRFREARVLDEAAPERETVSSPELEGLVARPNLLE